MKEWTGMNYASSTRAAETKTKMCCEDLIGASMTLQDYGLG